jgi:transglutaminase-like putative cysteine protease
MDKPKYSITSSQLWALLLGIHLVAAPFYLRIPVPVIMMVIIFTIWVATIALNRTRQPGRFARLLLLVAAIAIMTVSYGTLLGQAAGTGFLILLSFLKLFEIRSRRDLYIVVYLNYFLIASNFFHTQSPWVAIYVVAIVVYLTSLLVLFNDRLGTLLWQTRLRIASRIILQATPLMLVLFVLFPRIPGPLWGLPKDATTAVTGLSEDMSPGSMSSLIQSDEIAFRVRFQSDTPAHEAMYWRGPILSHYDGVTWTTGYTSKRAIPNLRQSGNDTGLIKYTVTMEPHQRDWLFALEYPVNLQNSGYRLTREMQLLNSKKITSIFQYSLSSDQQAINDGLFAQERERNLDLPGQFNPQTIALARTWLQESDGFTEDIVKRALDYFRNQPFVYTLNPTILGNDAMDDFLFDTRRGFCEHYSSAFVFLMRAAGIPARVVTGYQGGDQNPLDDYTIVRQSNAHAWAEVWLDGRGWVRVDPTAAVSPDRIESGIQNSVAERDLLPAILISDNALLRQARYQWDSFNNKWNEWVVGFDQKRQRQLFQQLGMKQVDWQDLIIWLVIGMLLIGGLIAWWVFRQGIGNHTDKIRQAYEQFCEKLAKAGSRRLINEGPQEYYARIRDKLVPACASAADNIVQQYCLIRYGGDDSIERARMFQRSVKTFKVEV